MYRTSNPAYLGSNPSGGTLIYLNFHQEARTQADPYLIPSGPEIACPEPPH